MVMRTHSKTPSNCCYSLMNHQSHLISTLIVIIGCLVLISATLPQIANASGYDPESTIDEIPIISARSLSPEISGRYEAHRRNSEPDMEDVDDYDEDDRQRVGSSSNNYDTYENPAYGESRRSAREADDIEKFFDRHIGPSANDIANGGESDDRVGSASSSNGDLPLLAPDTTSKRSGSSDDPFEMAASSPLATIFQTLLAAHKRPIVIETNDLTAELGGSDKPDETSSTGSSSANSINSAINAAPVAALGAQTAGQSLAMAPSIASYLSPIAAPSTLAAYGQQMMEQAAAMSGLAVGGATGGDDSAQIDQAASGANGAGDETGSGQEDDGSGAGAGQIQEIYIGPRPTLMKHFQSYSPSNKKLTQQSSNGAANYWRGAAPASSMGVQSSRPMLMGYGGQPMMTNEQMSSAYNADYSRYPVAASYAHQQESSNADQGGDDGTVEYNLSFGGGGGGSGSGSGSGSSGGPDDSEEMSSLSVDSQAATDESPASHQGPQMMPMVNYGRQRPTSTNQYMTFNPYHPEQSQQYQQQQQFQQHLQQQYLQQQQQHQAPMNNYNSNNKKGKWAKKGREPQQATQQHQSSQLHQQQSRQVGANGGAMRQAFHPARYHKDPSESVVQPINYGQFRHSQTPAMMLNNQLSQSIDPNAAYGTNNNQQVTRTGAREWQERQKYLELLDREIKNSPRYGQQQQQQGEDGQTQNKRSKKPGHSMVKKGADKRMPAKGDGFEEDGDDVYSNIQSETRNPTRVYQNQQQQRAQLSSTVAGNTQQNQQITLQKQPNLSSLASTTNAATAPPTNNVPINSTSGDLSSQLNTQFKQIQSNSLDNQHWDNRNSEDNNFQNLNGGHKQTNEQLLSNANKNNNNNNLSVNDNVITISIDQQQQQPDQSEQQQQQQQTTTTMIQSHIGKNSNSLNRVKRQDDADDRDDNDDSDGVWVDDDDDDDNPRQSSDVSETSQEPEDGDGSGDDQGGDESGQQSSYNVQPVSAQVAGISLGSPGAGNTYITRPHSYELSPDDTYAYTYPGAA